MCAPWVIWHALVWYSSSCHTSTSASIYFTAAMIRVFRSVRSHGNGGMNTFAYFARNALYTVTTELLVWYSTTQKDFLLGAVIFALHTLTLPSGRNVNYDDKQLSGKKILSSCFYLYFFFFLSSTTLCEFWLAQLFLSMISFPALSVSNYLLPFSSNRLSRHHPILILAFLLLSVQVS